MKEIQTLIEKAWENRELLKEAAVQKAVSDVVGMLDSGELRIAEKVGGEWHVNEWLKKAVKDEKNGQKILDKMRKEKAEGDEDARQMLLLIGK